MMDKFYTYMCLEKTGQNLVPGLCFACSRLLMVGRTIRVLQKKNQNLIVSNSDCSPPLGVRSCRRGDCVTKASHWNRCHSILKIRRGRTAERRLRRTARPMRSRCWSTFRRTEASRQRTVCPMRTSCLSMSHPRTGVSRWRTVCPMKTSCRKMTPPRTMVS
ncbi:hypothetical protein FOCC_FOCC016107, partial [Frankliniella occidentalis]